MKCLATLFFLMSTTAFAGGGIFVGNGGDGIEIGGSLYVLDLFTLGVEKSPYIGDAIDPYFYLPPHTIEFDYPRDLLARKLTDLNRVAPGLGDFVFESIKVYTWALEDWPLTPIPHPVDTVLIPPEARLLQIANRFSTTITIHAGSWNRLDDANKVALLIHEPVFSLVKPTHTAHGYGVQSRRTAQQITAAFFSPSYYAKSPLTAYQALADVLMIPDRILPLTWIRAPQSWRFNFGSLSTAEQSADFPFSSRTTYESLYGFLQSVCRKTDEARRSAPNHQAYVYGIFVPRAIDVLVDKYPVLGGGFQSYVNISMEVLGGPFVLSYIFSSVDECMIYFKDQLTQVVSSLH